MAPCEREGTEGSRWGGAVTVDQEASPAQVGQAVRTAEGLSPWESEEEEEPVVEGI